MSQQEYDEFMTALDRRYTKLEDDARDRGDSAEAERLELRHSRLVDAVDNAWGADEEAARIQEIKIAEGMVESGEIDDDDIHAMFA